MLSTTFHSTELKRTGSMVPAIGMMMLVMGAAMALVLDRLWLDAAQVELRTAAESAVLAAGHELLDDGMLVNRTTVEQQTFESSLLKSARQAAANIAGQNLVAGNVLELDPTSDGDIRFGKIVATTVNGKPVFLETNIDPTTIVVTANRLRKHGNPVAVLFQEIVGTPVADASEIAEVTIDSRPVGLKPLFTQPIPALPIAILADDVIIEQTWNKMIENAGGKDEYRYDEIDQCIVKEPDLIPEMVLDANFHPTDNDEQKLFNVVLLDFNSKLDEKRLDRQFRDGLIEEDLKSFDGELSFLEGAIRMQGKTKFSESLLKSLASVIGQKRIVFLFSQTAAVSTDATESQQIYVIKPVCIRLMAIRVESSGELQLVVQPTIMTSRTAVMYPAPTWSEEGDEFSNRYLKKLHLSN